jgi:hypothetical protein
VRYLCDHAAMDDDVLFTHALPPPFPPPPPGAGRKVLFYRQEIGEDEPRPEREDEDIMLRRVPRPVGQKFRAAAGGRAMTHAQYLAALVALHEEIRTRADAGNDELKLLLDELKLATVTV